MAKKIAIIGGGAAGMAAAKAALSGGAMVTLFEKNPILGRKLLITGKGRCNLTNDISAKEFIDRIPQGSKFLYSAIYSYSPSAFMQEVEALGVPLKTERGGRVFPVSDNARDIRDAFSKHLQREQNFHKQVCTVREIVASDGHFLINANPTNSFDCVIIATGGLSYPLTGSTGDGYRFARAFGHTVTSLYPSLVPLCVKENFVKSLEGLSLRNVCLTVHGTEKKPLFCELGELLFTADGITGPLALSASSYLRAVEPPLRMEIDLKPGLDNKQLDARLLRDFQEASNRDFSHAFDALLPALMRPVMLQLCGFPPEKKIHQITREERECILRFFKHFPLTFTSLGKMEEAIITAGGVSLSEVNPHTMESKLQKGLFFAGEVLDADGLTGGYNLQIAFSTGTLAGKSASKEGSASL